MSEPTETPPAIDRAVILIVDDERGPRESLRMILRPNHAVLAARDGSEALEILRTTRVDLLTLDLNMPGMQGEELMRIVRSELPELEIVIVTGRGTLESATEAIRAGVSDYLQKPFDVVQVTAAVNRALAKRRGRQRLVGFLEDLGETVGVEEHLEAVLESTGENRQLGKQVASLFGRLTTEGTSGGPRTFEFLEVLADTVETQSGFLRGHARRTGFYAGLLADRLSLCAREQHHVRIAGFLHDIGKVGVPTDLLVRPGALAPKERSLLEKHPEIGARLVEPLGVPTEISAAIRHHPEWWDGRGYGDGLYGEQIPLSARIVAIADAYDAMSCDRPYRKALSPEIIRNEFERYAGVQFDPEIAKEFLLILDTGDIDLQLLADTASGPGSVPPEAVATSPADSFRASA